MTVVTGDGDTPEEALTFEAFARVIGKSRPYVSALVKNGRIRPPALTPERKILASLAQQQIADGADPARGPGGLGATGGEGTYATQKARLTAAQAEQAELALRERRGELVDRAAVADVFGPLLRKLRDDLVGIPRDIVSDPEEADRCEEAITAALEGVSAEILTYAGDAGPG